MVIANMNHRKNRIPPMALYCPSTGLEVLSDPEWNNQKVSHTFTANFWVINDSIIYSLPKGYADIEGVRKSLTLNDKIASVVSGGKGPYVQIEDYEFLTGSDSEARRYITNELNDRNRGLNLIFCNLSNPLSIAVKIGKRFNTTGKFIHVARHYRDAIKLALEINGKKERTAEALVDIANYRDDAKRYLTPVELVSEDAWNIQTPTYANKAVLIDRCILHSTSVGRLESKHLPLIDRTRSLCNAALSGQGRIKYLVVDSRRLKGGSRSARIKYVQSLTQWHRQFPISMYVVYGANTFMKTALHLYQPSMPFKIRIARDLSHAFRLIRDDKSGTVSAAHSKKEREKPVVLSHRDIENLMTLVGKINWDVEGIDYRLDMAEDHPLYFLFQSINLIKEEFDAIFKERKLFEQQLIKSRKMEAIGTLAGGIAHDFNNMLGVIIGHTELATAHVGPSHPARHDLKQISDAAQRSADLTRQLLAFARRQPAKPKVLDLNGTISGMLKMLKRLIGEDTDLAWMPGANLWAVKIDPAQIDQILTNLCVNARDAASGAGTITIHTANVVVDEAYCATHPGILAGQYAMLAVSDKGSGMDGATLENLFEPFFTTKEVGKGTGLGLATVYGIVKQNKGHIDVDSQPGHGTTFKIFLPRTQLPVEKKREPEPDTLARGTETILVVEDEQSILDLCKIMLERSGYTVISARTPSEAIKQASLNMESIHLLVTDVVMPEMNGKELKERIDTFKPNLKALYMSGYTADVIIHQGIIESDVHFLQKPFSVHTLANKVRAVLDENPDTPDK
jgi:signal transduction histidine kinase/CheY-like chemotaxis protein